MEVKGHVKEIGATELFGEKEFKKRELILEVSENPQYPQMVKFEASQAKCDALDTLNVGDEINLHFNLNGRAWHDPKKGKEVYFNTLSIWKFDVVTKAATSAGSNEGATTESDDLPF